MNAYELGTIAAAGGGMIIDARGYNAYDVGTIVEKAGGLVIVRHADKFNAYECSTIASKNPGRVIFDFATPDDSGNSPWHK